MKKKILRIFDLAFTASLCVISFYLFYTGIYNITDIIEWRSKITKNLIYNGINLVTAYELAFCLSCFFIFLGIMTFYIALKEFGLFQPKRCICGHNIKMSHKYCPFCGERL